MRELAEKTYLTKFTYVSKCPELGVASFGNSPKGALENLKEAAELYLVNAKELYDG